MWWKGEKMFLIYRVHGTSKPIELLGVAPDFAEARKLLAKKIKKFYKCFPNTIVPDAAVVIDNKKYLIVDEENEMKRVLNCLTSWDYNYRTITNVRKDVLVEFLRNQGIDVEIDTENLVNAYMVTRK